MIPAIDSVLLCTHAQKRQEVDVFGAHHDEGRHTRALDPDPTWAVLVRRSINRYRDIEAKSGKSGSGVQTQVLLKSISKGFSYKKCVLCCT